MEIKVNDKPRETTATTLMELAVELALPEAGVAVALDNQMVKREAWAATPLSAGAKVIIIKAVCGG
ncbi:MAG: sulfur carrier protein ThiS [Prevotellaceae bacterium]|nr:sulfur carrier protein ThiS [Prevotellaceae bacterium]